MSAKTRILDRLAAPFARDDRPYRCRGCGARFELRYHVCPACGGYAVERDRWE